MPEVSDAEEPERPRATGWFEEPDEASAPLLTAVGRVVWGAAALEHSLLLELLRLYLERQGELPAQAIARFERLPAGPLLTELRRMDLPGDLAERIGSAVARRNALIHHPIEDPGLARAIAHGVEVEDALAKVERLALDCGEFAVELFTVAAQRLEAHTGVSREQMMQLLLKLDPGTPRFSAMGSTYRPAVRTVLRLRRAEWAKSRPPFELDFLGQAEERSAHDGNSASAAT